MDKEQTAIFRLQEAAEMSERLYQKPLLLTYSGGKDSDVMLALADAAGIDYEVNHSLTTADAPETIYHIKNVFHHLENDGIKCTIDIHRRPRAGGVNTMWNLIPRKMMPPTRIVRYCCEVLKESGHKKTFVALGIRWDESRTRKDRQAFEILHVKKDNRISVMSMENDEDRQAFESCPIRSERAVNPIIDWSNEDIWNYIEANKIETNPLYKCGFKRVGCIGCPMAKTAGRQFEFERYPKYKENYIRAFDRMLDERRRRGKMETNTPWGNTGEDVFHWWMQDGMISGQTSINDD